MARVTPALSTYGGSTVRMRSGETTLVPLPNVTWSRIGSPGRGGVGQSARVMKGFHSP